MLEKELGQDQKKPQKKANKEDTEQFYERMKHKE